MNLTLANAITSGLSRPSKMPCPGYGLPATTCRRGSQLAKHPGTVCSRCYALRGRYGLATVAAAQQRRLASLSHPEWPAAMAFLVDRYASASGYFRWHDSGDLQGWRHFLAILRVARLTPQVQHWLPTRETFAAQHRTPPPNLTIRYSIPRIDGDPTRSRVHSATSGVHAAHSPAGFPCPARDNGNHCGDCRACWDRNVPHVSYPLH